MSSLADSLFTDIAHNRDLLRSSSGDLDVISGLVNLRNALFRRLITRPGALIHRPDYGVGIQDYANSPNTIEIRRQIANRIGQQFPRDPRVELVSGVVVNFSDTNPSLTTIVVRIKVVGFDELPMTFKPFSEGVA